MKKLSLLHLFVLGIITSVSAQNLPMGIKLGEVDEKFVNMTKIDKFPDAEAVVLFDYGNVTYEMSPSASQKYERVVRIKILKKSGYKHANHTIYYFGSGTNKDKVKDLKGFTYNMENGKLVKTKLEKNAISDKRINKSVGQIKFAMPNVREGSIIEFSYDIIAGFDSPPTWFFQRDIPVLWSEYKIAVPEYLRFEPIKQIFKKFLTETSSHSSESFTINQTDPRNGRVASRTINYELYKQHWVLEDVPAFIEEKFVPSFRDCVMKVDFRLSAVNMPGQKMQMYLPTWEDLIKGLLKDEKFSAYVNDALPDDKLLNKITEGKISNKDKVLAVCNYVKNNISHNDRIGIYPRKTLKEVFTKKTGNCAEINLILVNMLKKLGLQTYPILLSTRNNGRIFEDNPLPQKLNYLIAYVNLGGSDDMLLDATDPILPAGMIDYEALNGFGLFVMEGELADWANLQNSKYSKSTQTVLANLVMKPNGTILGEVTQRYGGYEGIKIRKNMLKKQQEETNNEDEEDLLATDLQKIDKASDSIALLKLNTITFKNLQEYDKPLDGVTNIETSEFAQVNDDFIYFTPLLDYRMKENPFKTETRNFPVDYGANYEQNFYLNFTIPEGYKVEEMPKPVRLKWQDESIKFDYAVTATGDKVQLISKFVLSRPIFKAEEYKALRDLYAQIVAKQEEQIVLKKK